MAVSMKLKCARCGKEHPVSELRLGPDGKRLLCKNCLAPITEGRVAEKTRIEVVDEPRKKEGLLLRCKSCGYKFTRPRGKLPQVCPYCGKEGVEQYKEKTAQELLEEAISESSETEES